MKIMLDTSAYVGFKRNAVETVEAIAQAELVLFSPVVRGAALLLPPPSLRASGSHSYELSADTTVP